MPALGRSRASLVRQLIRRRYAGMAGAAPLASEGFARALQAGYTRQLLARAPRRLAELWSGCGALAQWVTLGGAQTVIDLGCGSGLDAWLMATAPVPPKRIIAIDLTAEMLASLQRARAGAAPCELRAIVGDFEQLPVANASCDLVTANAAFNLALDAPAAFAQAARVLRPGGRLQAMDLVREAELPEELLADPMGHSASLGGVPREHQLRDALAGAGFIDVVISGHRPFSPVVAVRIEARVSG